MRRIAAIGGGEHHHVDEGDYARMQQNFRDLRCEEMPNLSSSVKVAAVPPHCPGGPIRRTVTSDATQLTATKDANFL